VPFVAPPGIRWVRIDRASGKPVFGEFPTKEEPNSPVIWEAFQPQTEVRRASTSTMGDPYNEQEQQQRIQQLQAERQSQQPAQQGPAPPPDATVPEESGLSTVNGV
jgi:penicillin-binding protein 1A